MQFRNCATIGGSIFPKLGFSDVLTAFLACDTQVILYKKGEVPLREFIYIPTDNDILTHLYVKKDGRKTAYESFRMTETDYAKRVIGKLQYGSNIRGSEQYRKQLSKVLIGRCISRLTEE